MSLQAQEKERILFIGNSFTFYWNLPSQVEQMALEKGLQWEITQTTASGASLRDHWQGNKALKTKLLFLFGQTLIQPALLDQKLLQILLIYFSHN